MYSTDIVMRVLARAPAALRSMDDGHKTMFRQSLLDDRLRELLRLTSAQLNGCAPCSTSRQDPGVGDAEVVCLAGDQAGATLREKLAIAYFMAFARNPDAIDARTYCTLGEVFSPAEIVELGWTCAITIAGHRSVHSLDLFGDGDPVLS